MSQQIPRSRPGPAHAARVRCSQALLVMLLGAGAAQASQPDPGQQSAEPLVQQVRNLATEAVLAAMNFLGVPYQSGGNTADQGFDCSGFTRHVFELSLGLVLPRQADQQANEAGLATVERDQLKPGDLVFFNTLRRAFSHVGIYIGEGRFIHSPRVGGAVRIDSMRMAYWDRRFDGARRAELSN